MLPASTGTGTTEDQEPTHDHAGHETRKGLHDGAPLNGYLLNPASGRQETGAWTGGRIDWNQPAPSTAPRMCTITIFRIVIDGKIMA